MSPELAAVTPYHILSCREREGSERKETFSEGHLEGRLPWRWGARWPSPLTPVQDITEVTAQLSKTLWDGAGLCSDGITVPLLPLARPASLAFLGSLFPRDHPVHIPPSPFAFVIVLIGLQGHRAALIVTRQSKRLLSFLYPKFSAAPWLVCWF